MKYKDNKLAFIFQGETKRHAEMSYFELNKTVARLTKSLKDIGIKKGDRIVSYIPNLIETAIAMLATSTIGAIWASCGAELQDNAVIDRFGQIEPKVLFTVDGYFYRDTIFSTIPNAKKVVEAVPSIKKVIVVSYVSEGKPDISSIPNAVHWGDFISKDEDPKIPLEQLPFDHLRYFLLMELKKL